MVFVFVHATAKWLAKWKHGHINDVSRYFLHQVALPLGTSGPTLGRPGSIAGIDFKYIYIPNLFQDKYIIKVCRLGTVNYLMINDLSLLLY